MKIIAIANQKGGVGKTTTTINLAAALTKQGKRVLCIDFDPQGNLSACLGYDADNAKDTPTISELMLAEAAPTMMGNAITSNLEDLIQHNTEGIDYVPSNLLLASADVFLAGAMQRELTLKRILASCPLSERYDFIFIDCLPSLGILLTNALAAADSVLIPLQAQKLALDGLTLLMQVIQLAQRTINPSLHIEGIVVTMMTGTILSRSVVTSLIEAYGPLVYTTAISSSVTAGNSTTEQRSLVADAEKRHRGPNLGMEYIDLTNEFLMKQEEQKNG